jgi:predicted RecA/RadA family phage recombinase
MSKSQLHQDYRALSLILFAHTAAVVVGQAIWNPVFGAMVATQTADANISVLYAKAGRYVFPIATGVTIAQGDTMYYITADNTVTKVDPAAAGFRLGVAYAAGTAVGGYVIVEINLVNMSTLLG